MTKLKPVLLALLAVLAITGVAHAATFSSAKTNAARAEALTTPNASVFDLALGMRENDTDLVDESNSALAHSTCDGCRTVAIAFQVVIVQGRPSTVIPDNAAIAVNEGCTGCSALALAYQFVVGKGEPTTITSRGRKQLAAVGDDLLRLERSYKDLTDAEIQTRADADRDKVDAILKTELVPIHDGGDKPSVDDDREVRRAAA
jgi:putative peptide zinc metalloprotease protein